MPCSGQLHGMNMAKIIVWKIRIVLLLLGSNKTAWGSSQEETQEVLREALLSSIKVVGTVGQSLRQVLLVLWGEGAAGLQGDWRRQEAEAGSEQRWQQGPESWGPHGKPWKETLRQEHMVLLKVLIHSSAFVPVPPTVPET